MHYVAIVTLRTLAVACLVLISSYALNNLWKSGDIMWLSVLAAGPLAALVLWWSANRLIERQGNAIPF